MKNITTLFTAQQLEELLGKKYFYRQSIYRMVEEGKVSTFQVEGTMYFSKDQIIMTSLKKLAERIRYRYPWISSLLRIKFDENQAKELTVYGFSNGQKIVANTDEDTEEDLLGKIEKIGREVRIMPDIPVRPPHESYDEPPPPPPHHGHKPPPPHHFEITEVLRRIEERLARIEEKLG